MCYNMFDSSRQNIMLKIVQWVVEVGYDDIVRICI